MGLFGRKSSDERVADAMQKAERITAGRGLTGRLAKGMMGAENMERMQGAFRAAQSGSLAADMVAAGGTTLQAQVATVADTGQMVNFDPVVVIAATLPDGALVQVQTLVSKLQIPRSGDTVSLVSDPAQPGVYGYLGLVPGQPA
jgi:hypothetical protein